MHPDVGATNFRNLVFNSATGVKSPFLPVPNSTAEVWTSCLGVRNFNEPVLNCGYPICRSASGVKSLPFLVPNSGQPVPNCDAGVRSALVHVQNGDEMALDSDESVLNCDDLVVVSGEGVKSALLLVRNPGEGVICFGEAVRKQEGVLGKHPLVVRNCLFGSVLASFTVLAVGQGSRCCQGSGFSGHQRRFGRWPRRVLRLGGRFDRRRGRRCRFPSRGEGLNHCQHR